MDRPRKRGSTVRFSPKHDALTREKIQGSYIVNRLTELIKGEIEMAPHAVSAALGLLKKVLPDLQSVEANSTVNATITDKRSATEEVSRRIGRLAPGETAPERLN